MNATRVIHAAHGIRNPAAPFSPRQSPSLPYGRPQNGRRKAMFSAVPPLPAPPTTVMRAPPTRSQCPLVRTSRMDLSAPTSMHAIARVDDTHCFIAHGCSVSLMSTHSSVQFRSVWTAPGE